MGTYQFTVDIAAPAERVFELWTDLDRCGEWIGGITGVSDVTGPMDRVGTRYTLWFGKMASPSEILEVERPRHLRTRFGNRLLRGETEVTFESTPSGTRLTQVFRTEGLVPAISARIFASGSWKGSFRGELNDFVRIIEREAATAA